MRRFVPFAMILLSVATYLSLVFSWKERDDVYKVIDQYIQDARNENYEAVLPFCKEERFAYRLNSREDHLRHSKDYPYTTRFIDTYHIDRVKVKDNQALVIYSYNFQYEGYNDAGEKGMCGSIVDEGVLVWLELQEGKWMIVDFYEYP